MAMTISTTGTHSLVSTAISQSSQQMHELNRVSQSVVSMIKNGKIGSVMQRSVNELNRVGRSVGSVKK